VIDANRLLDQLMRSGFGGGLAGGLLSGTLAGSMAGGRGLASSALRTGGLALVAGMAWKAWQKYQQEQGQQGQAPTIAAPSTSAGAAPGHEFLPPPATAQHGAHGLAVLRAMIAAAKADGQVDAAEQQKIFGELGRLELTADEKAFVLEEFARPLDPDAIVAAATTPQLASEIYAASRLVIAESSPAESGYLQLLAARLGLAPALTAELDRAAIDVPSG
jgi:uncharacterized membrane protein YebE (DUF533 family)